MKIFISTDHRGIIFENEISNYLVNKGYEVIHTKLPHSSTDDYPDFAFEACNNVINNVDSFGILICGTGIGMSIAANKVKGIRAAVCHDEKDAYLARNDNNANVLCLNYNLEKNEAFKIIDIKYITTLPCVS